MATHVYKIYYMKSNTIEKIFVFIGGRIIDNKQIDINALYKLEPENKIFADIFNVEEKESISDSEIEFVPMEIHLDDTIETIKKKYILASKNNSPTYSGLYFYTKIKMKLTPNKVYEQLTQSGKVPLTANRLQQYILNIDNIDIPDKDGYTYDDILNLNLLSRDVWTVAVPIGHKFHDTEGYYNFTANPFLITDYDKLLLRKSNELLATTNQHLLMDTPPLYSNTIYACHVEDVLTYVSNIGLSQENAVYLYYPYLRENEIYNISEYTSKKEFLITETDGLVKDKSWLQNVDNTDLFYNMSNSYQEKELIIDEGIKHAIITLEPEFNYNLPLDVVFKLIHATETIPLIKYNPSGRQEKIYRLYADKVTTNGIKIPSLSKGTIFRLMKAIAKNKEVAVYIETDNEPLILSFFDNGRIEATIDVMIPKSIVEINEILKKTCNPIITIVSEYLQQRGYSLKMFEDIRNYDVHVSNITYELKSTITKKINFKSIIKCVSSVFNVLEDDINKGAVLRFKKVENYNEMDSMEAFIVESLNAGDRDFEIIKGLMDNFRISSEMDAKKVLVDFVSRQQVVQQAFRNRRYKIKNNPGFLTMMIREKFEANLITTMTGINNIGYLNTIPHYIKGLLIITQSPESSQVPKSRITSLCIGEKLRESKIKEDVIAPIEEPTRIQSVMFTNKQDEPDTKMQLGMLDMLLAEDDSDDDDDDDHDDDDDDDGDDDDNMKGGIGSDSSDDEDIVRDITGLSLSNPNPFSERLVKREPKLFLTNVGPGFSSYSRSCPSSNRRQPVILTQEEKDKIDKEHPGSYEHALSYQSSPDTPLYHYICPRYWSIDEGVSLTQADVDSGKYKKIIPKNAKAIPPGAGIYEFDSEYHRDEKGEYVGTQPGFMKPSKHPDGKCVPCCFKGWDTPSQIKLREKCQGLQPSQAEQPTQAEQPRQTEIETNKKKKLKMINQDKFDEYVKGPEKFPLESGRIGYLPVTIQRFLNIDNRQCQISIQNTNIKKNTPCLVRMGVEKNNKQSFIAAIACIYTDVLPANTPVPSIAEMREIMLNALDLDLFITLQNGNLIDIFDDGRRIELSRYENSKIYNSVDKNNPAKLQVIRKMIRSYENFREYINNPDILIGYEYLWDLICFNNDKLFEKGLNIVIIESKEDDVTGNVSIICPTNHYSNSYFDVNKRVAIIIKKEQLYEPIVSYEDRGTQYIITRRFSMKYKGLLPSLREFLDNIKQSLDKCSPSPSMPTKYKFKTNIPLEKMVHILLLKKYKINSQLMNYNGKVIGLDISKGKYHGMIPVYPSSAITKDKLLQNWIDDYKGYTYEETFAFLSFVHRDTKGSAPSLPAMKVVDNNLIVGILTVTNQFIPINPPTQDIYGDDIDTIRDVDYVGSNKTSLTSENVDEERLKYMTRIKLETGFFNTFRNMIRMLLGQFRYQDVRNTIENIVDDNTLSYRSKLEQVHKELILVASQLVNFTTFSDDVINDMDNITNCLTTEIDKCNDKPYCLTKDSTCVLLIPKTNLINGVDNEEMYYGRMADEIVRYSRIRSFIFEPKSYLSFTDVKYNLRENEVILLHTILNQEYFENLIPVTENKHIVNNTYDTVQPLITQPYSNIISENKATTIKCEAPFIKAVTGKWIKQFPPGSNELVFNETPSHCTFDIMTTIIQDYLGEDNSITTSELREVLADEYDSIYDEYNRAILGVFRSEGKSVIAQKLQGEMFDISTAIMNDMYYITILDIWIISKRFNIPIVLYSNSKFVENNKNIILCNSNGANEFYFIKVPSIKQGNASKYSLLVNNGKSLIQSSLIGDDIISEIMRQHKITDDPLIYFLETFNAPKKKLKIINDTDKPKKMNRKLKLVM